LRQSSPKRDRALEIVLSDLVEKGCHVGDGCKFGGDFLCYDGDREERHAFACVRVFDRVEDWPCLSPVDLTGFVRTMNTVGKICILACVSELGSGEYCVSYVDLILEKVLSNRAHKRKNEKIARKDMSKNLHKE